MSEPIKSGTQNSPEQIELRRKFNKDMNGVMSVMGNAATGDFSMDYVLWLEQKLLKVDSHIVKLIKMFYQGNGHLIPYKVIGITKDLLENIKPL